VIPPHPPDPDPPELEPAARPPLARLTPYELVFIEGDFESRVFPRILEEAEEQGIPALHPERFGFLSTAADVVRNLTPEDAAPEALEQYRALVFHAFHFWCADKPLYVLDPDAARHLVVATAPTGDRSFLVPGGVAYLQLPPQLFWASISAELTPEPVDGFFVTESTGFDALGRPFQHLEILMVLGIRRARAGFSVIPVQADLAENLDDVWDEEGRPGGDFANVLPGGELSGLYSILTAGEVLKLVGRAFWYVARHPERLVEVLAEEPRARDADPPPTHLGYTRVTLDEPAPPAGAGG
jgi:hypothetical protein